jgi:hypothetical protein
VSVSNRLRILSRPREAILIVRICWMVLILPVLLRLFDISRVLRIVTPSRSHILPDGLSQQRVVHLCMRVRRISGRAGRPSCLRRCLLLFHFLRYYGVPVRIHFGVKFEDGQLTGHSWLTVNGRLYHDTPETVGQFVGVLSTPAQGMEGPEPQVLGEAIPDFRSVPFEK